MASHKRSSKYGLFLSFDGRYGGDRYADELYSSLAAILREKIRLIKIKRAGGVATFPKLVKALISAHLDTRMRFLVRPFGLPLYKLNTYVIFHHYAPRYDPWYSRLLQLLDFWVIRLFGGLIGIRVVVVSEYWKTFWESRGLVVVACVYNTVAIQHSLSHGESRALISESYQLDSSKKWIYLGSDHPKKGWKYILERLHGIDLTRLELIVTGKRPLEFPLKVLWLDQQDYFVFVKSCDLVVSFSLFEEGWCRVVHEAIALDVPVVGNGAGGMSELLRLAGLPVTPNISEVISKMLASFNPQGNCAALQAHIRRNNSHNLGFLLDSIQESLC